jgi:hypothetical protein
MALSAGVIARIDGAAVLPAGELVTPQVNVRRVPPGSEQEFLERAEWGFRRFGPPRGG